MAFWDNLSQKASETTAKAMQKAKEISETTRLNSLISNEEKSINNHYFQIGKLYTSLHQNDPEEAFAGMLAAIRESEEKIRSYRQQIQDVKGIARCEKCGAEVPRGVSFCSSCGAPMPRVEAPFASDCIRCEACGAAVKRGTRFCTSCGNPMPQPEGPAAPDEGTNGTQTASNTCPNCGAPLDADSAFCTECGAKL